MGKKSVFTVAVLLSLSAGQAFAQSEGNGDPFPNRTVFQVVSGRVFVSDTGTAAYPMSTGNTAQPSSLALLQPSLGSEAQVQTAYSMPGSVWPGSVGPSSVASVLSVGVNR